MIRANPRILQWYRVVSNQQSAISNLWSLIGSQLSPVRYLLLTDSSTNPVLRLLTADY
jgi:hypothetical protein